MKRTLAILFVVLAAIVVGGFFDGNKHVAQAAVKRQIEDSGSGGLNTYAPCNLNANVNDVRYMYANRLTLIGDSPHYFVCHEISSSWVYLAWDRYHGAYFVDNGCHVFDISPCWTHTSNEGWDKWSSYEAPSGAWEYLAW